METATILTYDAVDDDGELIAQAASGPVLVRWLERIGVLTPDPSKPGTMILHRSMSRTWSRRIWAWRRGENPGMGTVDRLAVELGYHLSEIPATVERQPMWLTSNRPDAAALAANARRAKIAA